MEVIIFTFFGAVTTVDVLTACNNDVNFVEAQTVHFACLLNRRFVLRDKQSRPRFLALANFIFCLPPEIPRDIAFIPSILKRVQRWRVSRIRSIRNCVGRGR